MFFKFRRLLKRAQRAKGTDSRVLNDSSLLKAAMIKV